VNKQKIQSGKQNFFILFFIFLDCTVLMGAGVFQDQAEETFKILNQVPSLREYLNSLHQVQHHGQSTIVEEKPLWKPSQQRIESSALMAFVRTLEQRYGLRIKFDPLKQPFDWYKELHRWSIENLEEFWSSFWKFTNIVHSRPFIKAYVNSNHSISFFFFKTFHQFHQLIIHKNLFFEKGSWRKVSICKVF
jgi:hypothetical protein